MSALVDAAIVSKRLTCSTTFQSANTMMVHKLQFVGGAVEDAIEADVQHIELLLHMCNDAGALVLAFLVHHVFSENIADVPMTTRRVAVRRYSFKVQEARDQRATGGF